MVLGLGLVLMLTLASGGAVASGPPANHVGDGSATMDASTEPLGVVVVRIDKVQDYCSSPADLLEQILCRVM